MNLKIKNDLFNRLMDHQKESGFKKLEELVEYILESYLTENSGHSKNDSSSPTGEINQRLKDLGYL